jgi:hypothetical protein
LKNSGREITRLSVIVTLFSLGAFLSFPSLSCADASEFIPRIYRYAGELQIEMLSDHEVNKTPAGGIRSTDTVLDEKLQLFAAGYIYHPRFISFEGFIGGGLRQEKFQSNTSSDDPYTSSTEDEYGLRVKILPKHPYTLELFTERRSPLVQGRLSLSYKPVYYDSGAIFRYKKRRASLTLSYLDDISKYGTFSVNSRTHAADGSYSIGPFINSAGHRVTDSTTAPSGSKTTQIISYFDNTLYFTEASFSSHIDIRRYTQENPLSTSLFTDDTMTWKETASISLPWNFQTSGGYSIDEDTMTTKETSNAPETSVTRQTKNTDFTISTRVYNSLTLNYYINNLSTDSTGGEITVKTRAFTAGYVKAIPTGRLIGGFFFRNSDTDINNAPTIPDESHTIDLPLGFICDMATGTGSCFNLSAQNVDQNSIIVRVKSPFPPNDLIVLTNNVNYTVGPNGNKVLVTITNLPVGFPVPGKYEFHVTYSFTSEMVEYKTTNIGYNIRFELFNNLVNPYYGYSKQDQKVLSGELPGGPQDTATTTVGVVVLKPPYSFTEEFQSVGSNINPSRTFRSIADYRKDLAMNTNLYAKIYYTTTSQSGIASYSDNTLGADTRLQKYVPQKNLSLALGASYAHRQSFTASDTYLLSSSVMWKIGKLLLNASATMSESVSESPIGNNIIISEQFFLTVTRRLF